MVEKLTLIGDIYNRMPTGASQWPGLYQCSTCRGQLTITTKTPIHATKLDLRVWLAAIFAVLNSSKGISSLVLARMIGIGQKCTWNIGHAIRETMREDYGSDALLTEILEVDETSVGGTLKHKKG